MKPKPKLGILPFPAKRPEPPKHLSTASKRWWRSIVLEWEMSDTDVRILKLACEAFDAAEEAREVLAVEGRFYQDQSAIKAHPAVLVARDQATLAAKLVRDLRLDAPVARPIGRPGGAGPTPKRSA